jgi:hydroxymethylpyrimidine kinase/phosphomethylpyrimidine kinase/thiamine-phosphate diphosphorylase
MRRQIDLSAYLVLDDALCGGPAGVVATASAAARVGIRTVQLRLKEASTEDRAALGRALRTALPPHVALVMNDDVQAALACGADALHIGQSDMAPAHARALIGPNMVLGLSVETEAHARAVDPAIVDHVGAGPVFGTATKPDHAAPLGWDGLARVVAAVPLPAVAIGGVKAEHAAQAFAAGAVGIAVVSAICGQPDPEAAARAVRRAVDAARGASVATALSIAGSDPSGGAGIQADLKAFSARGVYGMAALTACTAQNTTGVSAVELLPPAFVRAQIADVLADIPPGAVKIGMIASGAIAEAVARALDGYDGPIVLDPVMVAKGGHPLLPPDAVAALRAHLLPRATVLTPNLPEAAALLGTESAADRETMEAQGRALLAHGPQAVLMKGGHLPGLDAADALITAQGTLWLPGTRTATANTHGTGCTLSAALAAELAKGNALPTAARAAKAYVAAAIAAADSLGPDGLGHGHGPTHHFHALWPVD